LRANGLGIVILVIPHKHNASSAMRLIEATRVSILPTCISSVVHMEYPRVTAHMIRTSLITLTTLGIIVCLGHVSLVAQEPAYPVITGYAGVASVSVDTTVIDSTATQRVVAELVSPAIARWVNLFAVSGVPRNRVDIVVVIHGEAAYALLNNDAHRARYGYDNPNTELIQKISAAGVTLLFCGQTLAIRQIAKESIAPQCKVVLGMATAVIPLQLRGYAYVKL
jgi:intracellular sulfur oxidation DsrE/DsrF family protein